MTWSRNSLPFMKPEGPLPRLLKPVTGAHPRKINPVNNHSFFKKHINIVPHLYRLQSGHFSSYHPIIILYVFPIYPLYATSLPISAPSGSS